MLCLAEIRHTCILEIWLWIWALVFVGRSCWLHPVVFCWTKKQLRESCRIVLKEFLEKTEWIICLFAFPQLPVCCLWRTGLHSPLCWSRYLGQLGLCGASGQLWWARFFFFFLLITKLNLSLTASLSLWCYVKLSCFWVEASSVTPTILEKICHGIYYEILSWQEKRSAKIY